MKEISYFEDNNLDTMMESRNRLVNLIIQHFSSIRKVKRSNERLEKDLWKRDINKVIESWETFYMRSCADYSLAFITKLKENISNINKLFLGIEKLRRIKSWNEDIHLYIEILENNKKCIIDFARDNFVYIYSGNYRNSRPSLIETISTNSISSSWFNENDSIISIANKIGEWENIEKFLNNLDNLKNQNTDEQFQTFEKRMNNRIKINIEWNWYEFNFNKDKVSDRLYSILVNE